MRRGAIPGSARRDRSHRRTYDGGGGTWVCAAVGTAVGTAELGKQTAVPTELKTQAAVEYNRMIPGRCATAMHDEGDDMGTFAGGGSRGQTGKRVRIACTGRYNYILCIHHKLTSI